MFKVKDIIKIYLTVAIMAAVFYQTLFKHKQDERVKQERIGTKWYSSWR